MVEVGETAPTVAELKGRAWIEEAPGIHSCSAFLNGVRWAVVRYAPGAERDEWCTDGHRGYVTHGDLSYELENGDFLHVQEGAAFWLPPGSRHRGVNGDVETQLFLIDVPDESTGADA